MLWKTTTSRKREVDRQSEPYEMTNWALSDWRSKMKAKGYENIRADGGFRDVFVKYEEAYEGYCTVRNV